MSSTGKTVLGRQAERLDIAPRLDGIAQVLLYIAEDQEPYVSGSAEAGRTLEAFCPFGTQQMCDNILAQVQGYRYQPYTAYGARLDPAAELGDGVSVGSIYSVIASMDSNMGSGYAADIAAPFEEEIDHEYEYTSKTEKTFTRRLNSLSSELRVMAGEILATVTQTEENIRDEMESRFSIQADAISAKVSMVSEEIGENRTVEWRMEPTAFVIKASVGGVSTEVLTVTNSGLSVEGTIKASSGEIGGMTIGNDSLSYGGMTWGDTETQNGFFLGMGQGMKLGQNFKVDMQGKITATGGTIGGFDISSDCIRTKSQTWQGSEEQGIYFGPSGLQLGKNFRVDSSGNLTAASGTFSGNVYAKNISYGGTAGSLPGAAISLGSINLGSLGTGIQTSLGYADNANRFLSGNLTPNTIYANYVTAKKGLYVPSGGATRLVSVKAVTISGKVYNILTV